MAGWEGRLRYDGMAMQGLDLEEELLVSKRSLLEAGQNGVEGSGERGGDVLSWDGPN